MAARERTQAARVIRDTRTPENKAKTKQREEVLWNSRITKDGVLVFLASAKKLGTARGQVQDVMASHLLKAHAEDAKAFMHAYDAMCKAIRNAQPSTPFHVKGSNVLGSYEIELRNVSLTDDNLVAINEI